MAAGSYVILDSCYGHVPYRLDSGHKLGQSALGSGFWERHLDHAVVLNERHLKRLLRGYFAYYHQWRPHRSLEMDSPDGRSVHSPEMGEIIEFPAVHGLHHYYLRKAAWIFGTHRGPFRPEVAPPTPWQARRAGRESDRVARPVRPGHAGGGKDPDFWRAFEEAEDR